MATLKARLLGTFRAAKLFRTILWRWIHVIILMSKLVECTTLTVNTNVNDGLQLTTMYQYWLPETNMQDINNRGNCGGEYMWTLCSSLFFYKSNTALKIPIKFLKSVTGGLIYSCVPIWELKLKRLIFLALKQLHEREQLFYFCFFVFIFSSKNRKER